MNRELGSKLNNLLDRLSVEDRYRCAAGIPGPVLELRSGSLPRDIACGNGILDFTPFVADITGLELGKLRRYTEELEQKYSFGKVLQKYRSVTPDFRSRLTLLGDYTQALVHRLNGHSVDSNATDKIREIRLRPHDQTFSVVYPANLVSVGLLWEVFAEDAYFFEGSVERIYDFGANIGLSAVYFHSLNPSAELICVEPMEENLRLLERNLSTNNIPSRLIRAAAGRTDGQATLFFGDQSHALPSLQTKQAHTRQVPMIPFDKIVNGKGYGLKIDIEGGEGSLAEFPSIINNAAWIVGELHYSADMEQNSLIDTFFRVVQRNFAVKKGRPIIYFVGDEVLLCESFKTEAKR